MNRAISVCECIIDTKTIRGYYYYYYYYYY